MQQGRGCNVWLELGVWSGFLHTCVKWLIALIRASFPSICPLGLKAHKAMDIHELNRKKSRQSGEVEGARGCAWCKSPLYCPTCVFNSFVFKFLLAALSLSVSVASAWDDFYFLSAFTLFFSFSRVTFPPKAQMLSSSNTFPFYNPRQHGKVELWI